VEARGETPAEALLAHVGWMRELAQALLGDPAAAEDVVQDSLIVAWRKAPNDGASLEPWLSRVLRNLAWKKRRSAARRADHEARASAPAPEADPQETAQRLELQRRVLDAVSSVEEPFRTTLVLRYFEGRTSADIARLQGVPAGTVRWRLSRGLDELRSRLDERHGGSRAAWSAWLAPFARLPEAAVGSAALGASATSATGVLVMGMGLKLALGFAAVALVGAAWWLSSDAGVSAEPIAAAPTARIESPLRSESAADANEHAVERHALQVESTAAESNTPRAAAPMTEPAPLASRVLVRFVDANGAPWRDVRVVLTGRETPAQAQCSSASGLDGRAELVWMLPPSPVTAPFRVEARRAGLGGVALFGAVSSGGETNLGVIELSEGARVRGRVVDEKGVGVPRAEVGLAPAEFGDVVENDLARHGDPELLHRSPVLVCDDAGAFEFDAAPTGTWRVWAHAEGRRYAWTEPFELRAGAELESLTLVAPKLLDEDRIEGRVVDAEGRPIPHPLLCAYYRSPGVGGSRTLPVAADGSFRLLVFEGGTYDFSANDADRVWGPAVARDVTPGAHAVELRLETRRDVELVVRSSEADALDDVRVQALVNDRDVNLPLDLVRTDERGRRFVHLPDFSFTVTVSAPLHVTQSRTIDTPAAVGAKLEFVLEKLDVVRGRVTARGAPLNRVQVSRYREIPDGTVVVNGFPLNRRGDQIDAWTDDEGVFEIAAPKGDPFYLRFDAGSEHAQPMLGPFVGGSPNDRPLEVSLDDEGGIEGTVFDASGQPVEGAVVALHCGDGAGRTQRTGAGGRYRFEHLAPGPWQVLLRDEDLRGDHFTSSSGLKGQPIAWNVVVRNGLIVEHDLTVGER